MHGIICFNRLYRYQGWTFEWHSHCGPILLRKDGEPRARTPAAFWAAVADWGRLSETERAGYMVEDGGCVRFDYGGDENAGTTNEVFRAEAKGRQG